MSDIMPKLENTQNNVDLNLLKMNLVQFFKIY